MAKSRIQGITIELDGATTGLQKALKDVNSQSTKLTTELKDVDKLLKFNPGNVQALAQKQKLLTDQIKTTTQKLGQLKQAESQVEAQFQSGKIGEEQYRAFKREIEFTEGALKGYKGQLANIQVEQEKLGTNTKRINTLFEATGSSVDDFADILGHRLVASIKDGTATSDQLEAAINKIGRASLGADTDINKMKNALDTVDDGSSIDAVRGELNKLSTQADDSADALEEIGNKLDAGNLMEAADVLGEVSDKLIEIGTSSFESAMDLDSLVSKVNNNFGLTGKAAEQTKDKILSLYKTGIADSYEEAADSLIATRSQLRGMNEESLGDVTERALAFAKAFDTDMNESLRGANALMTTYGMSATEAFDLMTVGAKGGLNTTDELGDNLAEYATLFEENGYSAQEMFEILRAGLNGGAYNLDKVNDLVKEFGVRISDGSIEKAVGEMGGKFESLFTTWKKEGGTNKELFSSIADEIGEMSNEQEKAAAISAIFGSLGEDAGTKVIESMGGISQELTGVKGQFDNAAGASEKLTNASDSQSLTSMWRELQDMLRPIGEKLMKLAIDILPKIVDMFKKIKQWIDNLGPVGKFIVELVGLFVALLAILAPIVAAVAGVVMIFVALGSTAGIVLAAIAAAIAIIIMIVKNWGAITDWLAEKWNDFKNMMVAVWEGIKNVFMMAWEAISTFFSEAWASFWAMLVAFWTPIQTFFTNIWTGIKDGAAVVWEGISTFFVTVWDGIVKVFQTYFNIMLAFWGTIWNGIWFVVKPIVTLIATLLEATWLLIKAGTQIAWAAISKFIIDPVTKAWGWVKDKFTDLGKWLQTKWNQFKAITQLAWIGIRKFIIDPVTSAWNWVKQKFTDLGAWLQSKWNLIKAIASGAWSAVKTAIITPIVAAYNSVKQKVTDIYNAARDKFNQVKSIAKATWDGVKSAMITPIKAAYDKIKGWIDKIKDFFSNLKLKIPKPSMPKMPSFSLKTSSKTILGKEISYPSGIDVKWFAKGGILTKPTAFGMNGNSVMAGGEAGDEAVIPLNARTLGMIGKGIADTMGNQGDVYEINVHVAGSVDDSVIQIMKREMQKILIEQTRRKQNALGGGRTI